MSHKGSHASLYSVQFLVGRDHPPATDTMKWTNPNQIDLNQPYIYLIRIRSPETEYRYVGKGSKPSRMDAYARNVQRVLVGETKRPAVKRDGSPQSEGNIKYRYVHLVLAVAAKSGWEIKHYPLENCEKSEHSIVEGLRKRELDCNLNDGPSWFIEDFDRLGRDVR